MSKIVLPRAAIEAIPIATNKPETINEILPLLTKSIRPPRETDSRIELIPSLIFSDNFPRRSAKSKNVRET